MNKKFLKFLIGGSLNTIFSYIIYCTLLIILNYSLSYILSICISIAFSYTFNTRIVFKIKCNYITALPYILIYIMQIIISSILLRYWVEVCLVNELIAPFINIVLITPIVYISTNKISNRIKSRFIQ